MRPEIEKVFGLIDNDHEATFDWSTSEVTSEIKEVTVFLKKDSLEFYSFNGDVNLFLFMLYLDSYESSIAEKILSRKKDQHIRKSGSKDIEELRQLLKNIDGKST